MHARFLASVTVAVLVSM